MKPKPIHKLSPEDKEKYHDIVRRMTNNVVGEVFTSEELSFVRQCTALTFGLDLAKIEKKIEKEERPRYDVEIGIEGQKLNTILNLEKSMFDYFRRFLNDSEVEVIKSLPCLPEDTKIDLYKNRITFIKYREV